MPKEFATKNRATSRNHYESRVPAWVWVFTGAVLGAFVMFLVHLTEIDSSSVSPSTNDNTQAKTDSQKDERSIPITFYEKLKESTDFDLPNIQFPEQNKEAATKQTTNYLIQVASFKSDKAAEQMRVELIMLGLTNAHTKQAEIAKGDTWHRVLVGPISSKKTLESTRKTLIDNEFHDAQILKQK